MEFKGTRSVNRAGIFYTISAKGNHPVAVVEKQAYIANPGSYEHLSLRINQV